MTDRIITGPVKARWTQDGYTLEFRAALYGREARLFLENVETIVAAYIGQGEWDLKASVGELIDLSNGGRDSRMTEIDLTLPREFFEKDAAAFRRSLERAAAQARAEADALDQRDQSLIDPWVERFLGEASSG